MKSKDFISGLLFGAALGITAGILLAPAKGRKNLKKISDAAKDEVNLWKDEAEEFTEDVKNNVKSLFDKAGTQADDFLQDKKGEVEAWNNKPNTPIS